MITRFFWLNINQSLAFVRDTLAIDQHFSQHLIEMPTLILSAMLGETRHFRPIVFASTSNVKDVIWRHLACDLSTTPLPHLVSVANLRFGGSQNPTLRRKTDTLKGIGQYIVGFVYKEIVTSGEIILEMN